jgi:hypothetical protein
MPERKNHLDALAISLLVACCLFWGFQQILIKTTVGEVPPLWQASLRMLGATALLWGWCVLRGVKLFERDGTLRGGLLAGALFAAEFCCIYLGLMNTTASRLTVFLYTSPFCGGAAAAALCAVRTHAPVQWAGLAIAFAAVAVAFSEGFMHGSTSSQLQGRRAGPGGRHPVGPDDAGHPRQRHEPHQRRENPVLPGGRDHAGGARAVAGAGRDLGATYQSRQPGLAMASLLTTFSMGWPSSSFLMGSSCFLPLRVRGTSATCKDVVGHKARAERGADGAVDARAQCVVQRDAGAQHHEQRHVALAAQVFQVHHHAVEHLGQGLHRAVELAGAHAQAVAVDGGVERP